MKVILTIITVLGLSMLSGCNGTVSRGKLLTVDFQKGQTLRYKFVSSRNINVDLGQAAKASKANKFSESMEMVVAYTPIKIDPYGLTTIKATCESVKTMRSLSKGRRTTKKDAVEHLAGKTFTFTVGPTGRIEDYSKLNRLIQEIGKKAFRPNSQPRTKEPDMIGDFIATQWFLWDSVSAIEKPVEGVCVGQSWRSKLSIPTPMVMRKARDVTYTLEEIRQTEKGQLAVIHSSYLIAKSTPRSWPIPYSGRLRLAGPFGFYRNYKVLDLHGQGEELFNIDRGRTEQYNQQYQIQLKASLLLPLGGVKPRITIKQNLTMKILE